MISNLKNRAANLTLKQKTGIAAVALVLAAAGLGCNFLLTRAAAAAQTKVLEQMNQGIDGKITVGSMDVSFLGTVNAKNVAVYDRRERLLGKAHKVRAAFSLPDLLSGKADLQALKTITVESPVVIISQQDGRWNWEDLFKPKPDRSFAFRGPVIIRQGSVALDSPDNCKLEAVSGTLSFATYPAIPLDFTGRKGSIPLNATGAWSASGDGAVAIKAEKAPLTDVPLDLLVRADIKLSGGIVEAMVINVTRQAGEFTVTGEGAASGLTGTAAGYNVTEGSGKFKLHDNYVALQNVSLRLNGEKMSLAGTVAVDGSSLNLDVAAEGFNPSVFAGPSFRGLAAFQARIKGTPSSPQAQGWFSIPEGKFGSLTFLAATGDFYYTEGVVTLYDTRAAMWDGTIFLGGKVVPLSQKYSLTVAGSGVDSALLSDKDIRGRTDFDAEVSGQGQDIAATGSFRMGQGSFYGVPFLAMTGNFAKHGEKVDFTNVVVTTLAGSFEATGFTEGLVIKLRKSEAPAGNPVENVKETVNKTINKTITDKLRKLLP